MNNVAACASAIEQAVLLEACLHLSLHRFGSVQGGVLL
jgi:hypothetical protein